MKLLLDENLPESLVTLLAGAFESVHHAKALGLAGRSDELVWDAARTRNALLVTKDEDFCRWSIQRPNPPKVLWVRLGNATAEAIADRLLARRADLEWFVESPALTFLALR